MSIYTEYLTKKLSGKGLEDERKVQLRRISSARGGRPIFVYAANMVKGLKASTSIDYSDILHVKNQIAPLAGDEIDILIETPGGLAEVVEDIIRYIRGKYQKVGIIVPGWAKSAGTIFTMAGDEILMGPTSALGPIDAQITHNGKSFSAGAFLEGLNKIKEEVDKTGKLNQALIPMLQKLSPGEIQHCDNAQNFSQKLVTDWLEKFKFKYWEKHSNGAPVTPDEKHARAALIAGQLCDHSHWLTHGRSIKINDLRETMKLKITDYSENTELNDAIERYFAVLRITFEQGNFYKIYETIESQIYLLSEPGQRGAPEFAKINLTCGQCKKQYIVQANFTPDAPLEAGSIRYPIGDNIFKCPHCGNKSNIRAQREEIEKKNQRPIVK